MELVPTTYEWITMEALQRYPGRCVHKTVSLMSFANCYSNTLMTKTQRQ